MAISKYNNIESDTIEAVGFVDPDNDDFHLLPDSQAVNAGSDTGFAPFDFDDVPRPQGGKSDIGAFESRGDETMTDITDDLKAMITQLKQAKADMDVFATTVSNIQAQIDAGIVALDDIAARLATIDQQVESISLDL